MLYGRRVIAPQRVPPGKDHRHFILDKSFQNKYTWYLFTAVAVGSTLFFLPSFYFINQNYELFKSLAYDTAPYLVEHLEREVHWMTFFLAASFALISAVTFFLSVRMTRNLLTPLIKMEKHMHQLMLGHWHIPDFHLPEDDDFRDLSLTYDYFYRALKANTESELRLLEKIKIDPLDREAYAAWKQLLTEKRARLGIEEPFITNENIIHLEDLEQKSRVS